jgi:hypothetical protein
MFAKMYRAAIRSSTIRNKNQILKNFNDGEMRQDPDKTIKAKEIHQSLLITSM